jgi:thiamine biosynthesis protein ThiS
LWFAAAACDNSFSMKLRINGEDRDFPAPLSLNGLLDHLGMKADRVAVELNRLIVPRDQWPQRALADGDQLEIVHFVGGG